MNRRGHKKMDRCLEWNLMAMLKLHCFVILVIYWIWFGCQYSCRKEDANKSKYIALVIIKRGGSAYLPFPSCKEQFYLSSLITPTLHISTCSLQQILTSHLNIWYKIENLSCDQSLQSPPDRGDLQSILDFICILVLHGIIVVFSCAYVIIFNALPELSHSFLTLTIW